MSRIFARTVPVSVIVSMIDRNPTTSRAEDSPEVHFRAKVKFSNAVSEGAEPVFLHGRAQVFPDRTVSVTWVLPQHGVVQGIMVEPLMGVYRDTLKFAFEGSDLALLGVE